MKGVPTAKSVALKQRLHEGARIADQMPKLMTLDEVAAKLGLSTKYVRRLECLALYKVQARLKEYANR